MNTAFRDNIHALLAASQYAQLHPPGIHTATYLVVARELDVPSGISDQSVTHLSPSGIKRLYLICPHLSNYLL